MGLKAGVKCAEEIRQLKGLWAIPQPLPAGLAKALTGAQAELHPILALGRLVLRPYELDRDLQIRPAEEPGQNRVQAAPKPAIKLLSAENSDTQTILIWGEKTIGFDSRGQRERSEQKVFVGVFLLYELISAFCQEGARCRPCICMKN